MVEFASPLTTLTSTIVGSAAAALTVDTAPPVAITRAVTAVDSPFLTAAALADIVSEGGTYLTSAPVSES